jgi:catechol 2,3-dioxygenase-like lactoylglutathione lyase family enzyme
MKSICSILFTLLLSAPAQTAPNPDGADPAPFLGIAHTAIRTANLPAAQAFYEKLGFEKAFSAEKNGVITQAFYKINDREFLEIYPQTDPAKEPIGFMHLCFDGKDLEALHTHYLNVGLQPTPLRTAGMGNLLFTLRGPENQNIEYTQYMPTSRHTLDRGRHLGPQRISTEMYAMGLPMQDLPAAMTFYKQQLGFPTVPDRPDLLLIPGSAQLLDIFSDDLKSGQPDHRAYTWFSVTDLGKTAADLKSRHIPFKRTKGELTLTDPDGNLLMLRADHTLL